jgi:hypothetical protein
MFGSRVVHGNQQGLANASSGQMLEPIIDQALERGSCKCNRNGTIASQPQSSGQKLVLDRRIKPPYQAAVILANARVQSAYPHL